MIADQRNDGSLLTEVARSGSDQAFDSLVQRHFSMVFNLCCRQLGESHDAEDASQAVFIVLWKNATTLQQRSSVASWLYQVARNICRNAQRARQTRSHYENEAAEMICTSPSDSSPSDTSQWDDIKDVLDAEIEQLPEKYRLPIILFHLEGRRQIEVANVLGTKQSTVAKRLKRGRELLRTRLFGRGITVGSAAFAIMLSTETASASLLTFHQHSDQDQASLAMSFVESTTKAAKSFARDESNQQASLHSSAMAKRALRTMTFSRLRTAAAIGAMVFVLTLGLLTVLQHTAFAKPTKPRLANRPNDQLSATEPLGADTPITDNEERTAKNDAQGIPISTPVSDGFQKAKSRVGDTTALKITPRKSDIYELQQKLVREHVFLHMVRSPWKDYGWDLKVPKGRLGREQSVDELLQAMADLSNIEMTRVRNSVGVHYIFYQAVDDKNLLDFKNALARKESIEGIRATNADYDIRLVSILRPHLKNGKQKSIARQLLLSKIGMTATALLLPLDDAIPFLKHEFMNGNRVQTTKSLGTVGGPDTTALLASAISDHDKEVRRVAVQSLRYFGTKESLRVLNTAVSDQDVDVRKALAEAFSWTEGKQARMGLGKLVNDDDTAVRMQVALALGWQGTAANELLIRTLKDKDATVRRATTASLGRIANAEAIELLAKALHDTDYLVREGAGEALGGIGNSLVLSVLERAVHNQAKDIRWVAAGALGRIRSDESLRLLKILTEDEEIDVQKRSVYHLGIFGEEVALPLLKEAAEKHTCCHIQSSAATALGEIGGEKSVVVLAEILARNTRSDYWDVRRTIAHALANIGTDNAIQQVARILENEVPTADTSERDASLILATRRGAIDALGGSGNPTAIPLLQKELSNSDRQTRHHAINSLARLGGTQARELLLKHMKQNAVDSAAVRDAVRNWLPADRVVR